MTMDSHTLADHSVRVGGVIEFYAANTDNGENGFDRGRFSRLIVDYSNDLDNGVSVAGQVSYTLNQRDGDVTNFAPDVLFMSVGGGFGTVTLGSHAMAFCSLHARAYALVPNGWWGGMAEVGFGAKGGGWFAEDHGCATPTAISYASPSMSGLVAMVSYVPNFGADQAAHRVEAAATSFENSLEAMVRYAANMGAVDIAVSGGLMTAEDDAHDSTVIGLQLSFGGITVGTDWFENARDGGSDGYTIGAKYTLGSISPAIAYSSADYGTGGESTYLTVGASYQVGGGMSVFAEYQDIESTGRALSATGTERNGEDSVVLGGVAISF